MNVSSRRGKPRGGRRVLLVPEQKRHSSRLPWPKRRKTTRSAVELCSCDDVVGDNGLGTWCKLKHAVPVSQHSYGTRHEALLKHHPFFGPSLFFLIDCSEDEEDRKLVLVIEGCELGKSGGLQVGRCSMIPIAKGRLMQAPNCSTTCQTRERAVRALSRRESVR